MFSNNIHPPYIEMVIVLIFAVKEKCPFCARKTLTSVVNNPTRECDEPGLFDMLKHLNLRIQSTYIKICVVIFFQVKSHQETDAPFQEWRPFSTLAHQTSPFDLPSIKHPRLPLAGLTSFTIRHFSPLPFPPLPLPYLPPSIL